MLCAVGLVPAIHTASSVDGRQDQRDALNTYCIACRTSACAAPICNAIVGYIGDDTAVTSIKVFVKMTLTLDAHPAKRLRILKGRLLCLPSFLLKVFIGRE